MTEGRGKYIHNQARSLTEGLSRLNHNQARLFVGCLTSQQHASVSQEQICTDNFTCCHIEIEVADPTFYLTQSQYTDTGSINPSADPIMKGACVWMWEEIDRKTIKCSVWWSRQHRVGPESRLNYITSLCQSVKVVTWSLLLVVCLMSQQCASVYLRDGSAQTILHAATLRLKLQIKVSISPSHSMLTLGQPVPLLTLLCQAPGRVAFGVSIFKWCVDMYRVFLLTSWCHWWKFWTLILFL